jgi:hypothetical protein
MPKIAPFKEDFFERVTNVQWGGLSGFIAGGLFYGDAGGPAAIVFNKNLEQINEVADTPTANYNAGDEDQIANILVAPTAEAVGVDRKGNALVSFGKYVFGAFPEEQTMRLQYKGPDGEWEGFQGWFANQIVADSLGNFYVALQRNFEGDEGGGESKVIMLSPKGSTVHTYLQNVSDEFFPPAAGPVCCTPNGIVVAVDKDRIMHGFTEIDAKGEGGKEFWSASFSADFLSLGTGIVVEKKTVQVAGTQKDIYKLSAVFAAASSTAFGLFDVATGKSIWINALNPDSDLVRGIDVDAKGHVWICIFSQGFYLRKYGIPPPPPPPEPGEEAPPELPDEEPPEGMLEREIFLVGEMDENGGSSDAKGCVAFNDGKYVATLVAIPTGWWSTTFGNAQWYQDWYVRVYDAEKGALIEDTIWGQWGAYPSREFGMFDIDAFQQKAASLGRGP